jgi:molecular chaperone DnaK
MKEEAEIYAGEDEQRKLVAELQNRADSLFYSYESALRDSAGTVSEELKAQAAAEAEELRSAIADKNADPGDLAQKLDALQQTIFNIGAGLYRQARPESSGADIENEMPGAHMSSAPSAPSAYSTPVEEEPVSAPAAPIPTAPQPTPQPVAASVAAGQAAQATGHYESAYASPSAGPVYGIEEEEEFDIDSTLAANYEAIE